MEPAVREAHKEKVERKSTDLLLEHQRIQMMPQKLQSLQDKKKHHLKEACASEEEKREDSTRIFQALSEKSGESRSAASEVKEDIRIFQAGEDRRGSCASQSNGCCWDRAMLEQFFAFGDGKAKEEDPKAVALVLDLAKAFERVGAACFCVLFYKTR